MEYQIAVSTVFSPACGICRSYNHTSFWSLYINIVHFVIAYQYNHYHRYVWCLIFLVRDSDLLNLYIDHLTVDIMSPAYQQPCHWHIRFSSFDSKVIIEGCHVAPRLCDSVDVGSLYIDRICGSVDAGVWSLIEYVTVWKWGDCALTEYVAVCMWCVCTLIECVTVWTWGDCILIEYVTVCMWGDFTLTEFVAVWSGVMVYWYDIWQCGSAVIVHW